MIKCSAVSKSFGSREVIKNVSLEVKKGEIFGLLGPSGAGKTTLIRMLTGRLEPGSGDAEILGKNSRKLSGDDRKKIGIMMDDFGMYERLSCRDNLKLFAEIYGIDKRKVSETLEQVGLKDSAGKRAADLSKGMLARLQLARVFMQSPDVIFLDEPTSGLDPQTMRSIHELILGKRDEGCTIFLTTHNMEEAHKLCDRVALLNEGVIADQGNPDELCRKYDSKKSIKLHLKNGEDMEIPFDRVSAHTISDLMERGELSTVHTSEPNLETVFLSLTGRKLEEN